MLAAKKAGIEFGGFVDAPSGFKINYEQLKDWSTGISSELYHKHNVRSGDVVAFMSRNTVWYPVAMFAVMRLGGIISGSSPAYTLDEMTFALRVSGAKYLFTSPTSEKIATEAAIECGIPKENIFLLEGEGEYKTIKELLQRGLKYSPPVEPFEIPKDKTNSDVCGYLSFSSGTTGLPKAVMISQGNVIAQALQMKVMNHWNTSEDMIASAVLPLFHSK